MLGGLAADPSVGGESHQPGEEFTMPKIVNGTTAMLGDGTDPPASTAKPAPQPRPRLPWSKRRYDRYTVAPLLLISANLALFAVFFVWPAVIGLLYSFTSYTGVGSAPFVGLDNYRELFQDSAFFAALLRTLIFTGGMVPLT